jgi:hypothetical protein
MQLKGQGGPCWGRVADKCIAMPGNIHRHRYFQVSHTLCWGAGGRNQECSVSKPAAYVSSALLLMSDQVACCQHSTDMRKPAHGCANVKTDPWIQCQSACSILLSQAIPLQSRNATHQSYRMGTLKLPNWSC